MDQYTTNTLDRIVRQLEELDMQLKVIRNTQNMEITVRQVRFVDNLGNYQIRAIKQIYHTADGLIIDIT